MLIPLLAHEQRAAAANALRAVWRPVDWKPREPGLNLSFTGLEVGYYCTDVPASGWVLQSRGAGGCWNDRTWPEHCPFGKPGEDLVCQWQEKVKAYSACDGYLDLDMERRYLLASVAVRRVSEMTEDEAVAWGFDAGLNARRDALDVWYWNYGAAEWAWVISITQEDGR